MTCIRKPLNGLYNRFVRLLYMAVGVYLIFLLLRYPALSLQYALAGLHLWFEKMIPTLLPFMILSGILINMNLTEGFVRLFHPILRFFYGTTPNGSYTLLMGFLCGFPMGARIAGELCRTGRLSVREGNRLLAFCNNIGPIYFLSFVVSTLSLEKPLLPFLVMYGVPLIYGLFVMRVPRLFRCRDVMAAAQTSSRLHRPTESINSELCATSLSEQIPQAEGLLAATDNAVLAGLTGIAKLGGYMVFFNLLNILFIPFVHLPATLLQAYYCILEITGGIARCGPGHPFLVLVMLPFGGFSCIAQTYSMIRDTGLSIRTYICHKLAQTALTALIYIYYFSR
ncbi:MAG: hypothetical protein K2I53_13150 [Lachnospiraceae bacterium]|nr:hypothetical protein [Lachnospiraceae bacterium]